MPQPNVPASLYDAASRDCGRRIDVSPEAVAALQLHPAFDQAVHLAVSATVDAYRGNWVLRRLVNDRGRFILGLMLLDLHFTGGGGAGFTVAELRKEAAIHGVCSPGRTTAVVASLRLLGMLKAIPANDRRVQRLVPAEPLLALHRARWRSHFTALALLRPEAAAALDALERPEFLGRFVHVMIQEYRDGLRVLDAAPALRPASERDGGMVVLLALALAGAAGETASITALARRFSLSRAHVLTILREAEQSGLAEPVQPRGGYRARPGLTDALRRFFAGMFLIQLAALSVAGTGGWESAALPEVSPTSP